MLMLLSSSFTSTGSFGRLEATTIAGHSPITIDSQITFNDSIEGNVSGSATSTGSFGRVQIKPSGDARLDIVSTTYSELYFNDASNAGILSYNHGSDQFTLYTGGGIRQKINSSTTEFIGANYKISGSSTSTGSFGRTFIGDSLSVNTNTSIYPFHVDGHMRLESNGRLFLGTGGAIADAGSNTYTVIPKMAQITWCFQLTVLLH